MNKQTSTPSQIHRLQQTIYENLPVGMELYDGDGYLIEINSVGLKMMGVKDKQDMLGINIFENPALPEEIKLKIRDNEEVEFTFQYDFSKIKSFSKNSKIIFNAYQKLRNRSQLMCNYNPSNFTAVPAKI